MARLGGYSGETPQGEEASPTFLQLFAQKIALSLALCPNTLAKGHFKPVGGTPEARKKQTRGTRSFGSRLAICAAACLSFPPPLRR
jgi:hypothetical protein